ncbi:MAG: PD-(D/E)XK nuclease family protein [Clostridia bacterium]|nr:PD-(D/E)XK nuclease family protein [Clostridia bacterium]
MLKLICGPSGSGKTALLTDCIRQDIQEKKRCFLLIPEQQAYISERDLPAVLPSNAGLYFEIVNFSGLAEDVFREYGGVTQRSLSAGIRSLLMWDTLRTLAPLLRQYGKSARGDTTLTALMTETVRELRTNGIDGAQLEAVADKLPKDSPLHKKLTDLALIDEAYHARLNDGFGGDTGDKLLRMAEKLKTRNYFAGSHLYIDSFTSFTTQEYTVLREILKQADRVTVTLCTNSFSSALPHFESLTRTAMRLTKLASEANVNVERQILSAADSQKPPELQILERDLWRFNLKKQDRQLPPKNEAPAIRLISCTNLYEEAEAAALHVLELVQEGMLYGEIALIVRDTEVYRGVLDAALERHGIPCFLSERTDLSSKPLARLILSALRAVSRGYHVRDILTLIKTGLAGVDMRDAALFEEYCETWHINGSRFRDEVWSMNPDGLTTDRSPRAEVILESANRVRRAVIEPLEHLSADLRAAGDVPGLCRAVYDYLNRLQVAATLAEHAKEELLKDQRREAGETVRLYRFITDCLTSMCELLPDSRMTVEEFSSALSLLLSTTDMGSVPNRHDCVVIGSAATLRVENIRACLLLGLCEGEFPRAVSDDGILSEADKTALEDLGISLDSRERLRNSEELFYVYRAMTKPCEKLILSTVAAQPDGSARTPSLAFTRAAYLTDGKVEIFDMEAVRRASEDGGMGMEPALRTVPPVISPTTLRLSQSKIRDFVLCPYRYYSTHQLKLREKKDSTPSYADDGTFLHYVFEKFLRASLTEERTLRLPPQEEMESIADDIIEGYLNQVFPVPPEKLDRRLLHLFARLRKMALLMLGDIVGELRASAFVPYAFEQIIGMPGEKGLPAVELELKNGSRVRLSGMVDRIDLYEQGDHLYVRVVDYKSGEHKFKLDDVRTGLDIQLVLYLYAVLASDPQKNLPGGAQYLYASSEKGKMEIQRSGFLLSDTEIRQAADSTEGGVFSKKLTARSMEEMEQLTEQMKETVSEIAERILAGEAQKTPSKDACGFCPIRTHCDQAYRE